MGVAGIQLALPCLHRESENVMWLFRCCSDPILTKRQPSACLPARLGFHRLRPTVDPAWDLRRDGRKGDRLIFFGQPGQSTRSAPSRYSLIFGTQLCGFGLWMQPLAATGKVEKSIDQPSS